VSAASGAAPGGRGSSRGHVPSRGSAAPNGRTPPGGRGLAAWIGALATAGAAIAGYLTWVHYSGDEPLCLASGGCERVQESRYAEVAGVPVALIGVVGYLAILGSLALRGEAGRMATALLAFAGLGFSVYLTWAELFEIEAVCQWCVASAAIMTVIAALSAARAWRAPAPASVDET
jgi:uncharacterized membrane protein